MTDKIKKKHPISEGTMDLFSPHTETPPACGLKAICEVAVKAPTKRYLERHKLNQDYNPAVPELCAAVCHRIFSQTFHCMSRAEQSKVWVGSLVGPALSPMCHKLGTSSYSGSKPSSQGHMVQIQAMTSHPGLSLLSNKCKSKEPQGPGWGLPCPIVSCLLRCLTPP